MFEYLAKRIWESISPWVDSVVNRAIRRHESIHLSVAHVELEEDKSYIVIISSLDDDADVDHIRTFLRDHPNVLVITSDRASLIELL